MYHQGSDAAALRKTRRRLRLVLHLEDQYSSMFLVHEGRPGGALQHNCRRDAAVAALRPAQPNSFWQPLEMVSECDPSF